MYLSFALHCYAIECVIRLNNVFNEIHANAQCEFMTIRLKFIAITVLSCSTWNTSSSHLQILLFFFFFACFSPCWFHIWLTTDQLTYTQIIIINLHVKIEWQQIHWNGKWINLYEIGDAWASQVCIRYISSIENFYRLMHTYVVLRWSFEKIMKSKKKKKNRTQTWFTECYRARVCLY